jgi:hypothetical protein
MIGSTMGFSQEMIYPATIHTNLSNRGDVERQRTRQEAKTGESIEIPFVDDFSADHFPGNAMGRQVLWENRGASINTGRPLNPPTIGAVSLDGADEVGYPYDWTPGTGLADTLTSCPINLEGDSEDGFGISFYYQPKGNVAFQNAPTATDSLFLEFYAPDLDQWFWIWSTVGDTLTDGFTFVYIPITQSKYLMDGFQFRFRNYAYLQGALSVWNLDYIWVDVNNINQSGFSNDVAFVDQANTLLNEFTAMPLSHFAINPASHMRPSINVEYRNLDDGPRTLQGNTIRLIDEGTGTVEGDYLNLNNPAIQAQSELSYFQSVHDAPNSITYDPSLSDTDLKYEVQFLHTVSDFSKTSSNDTMRFTQQFFTNYAYDDGSAEYGYGLGGSGDEVALGFTNFKNDSIWALQIYTMPINIDVENSPMTIKVWNEIAGQPGIEIGSTLLNVQYSLDSYQETTIYQFNTPIFVPQGRFYIGFQQPQALGMRVGMDINTDGNDGNLFYRVDISWTPSSQPGTVMMRPMFTTNGYEDLVTKVKDLDFSKELKLYPNPANGQVNIATDRNEQMWVTVSDMMGRTVGQFDFTNQARFDSSDLTNGIYILTFDNKQGARGVKKLVVNH